MEKEQKISRVLECICELYPVTSHLELVEKVAMGYMSDNFILRSGETKLFLKQYRFDDAEKIRNIHKTKFFFSEGGIPVILPLRNSSGETFFENQGKYFALFPFVEGRIIPMKVRSVKAFASAATMLAHIHLWSAKNTSDIEAKKIGGWDKEKFFTERNEILKGMDSVTSPSVFDDLARGVLAYKTNFVEENTLRYEDFALEAPILVHGDYHGKNIFYGDDDEVSHVFDLEKAEYSPRILEVIRSMDFMCFSGKYEPKNYANAKIYLDAYRSVFPFDQKEFVAGLKVHWIKKAHSLWIETEHYVKANSRVDLFLEGELTLLKYYASHFDTLSNIIV